MGHEYNEKMFPVHTPSILHGVPMGAGTILCLGMHLLSTVPLERNCRTYVMVLVVGVCDRLTVVNCTSTEEVYLQANAYKLLVICAFHVVPLFCNFLFDGVEDQKLNKRLFQQQKHKKESITYRHCGQGLSHCVTEDVGLLRQGTTYISSGRISV